jgi:sulfate adenylyltransferase
MSSLGELHGGCLIERYVSDEKARTDLLNSAKTYPSIILDGTGVSDMEMMGSGALSPLAGFMGRKDFVSVLENMRLDNGLPWTIPIVLGTDAETAKGLTEGQNVALKSKEGKILGVLNLEEIYAHDAASHARKVFGTDEESHPGVQRVYGLGEVLLGGKVTVLMMESHAGLEKYHRTPLSLREEFKQRRWKTIVAFQTRNPIHRAHEYLMKCALESSDGLLLHPLVGQTKSDDLPSSIRIKSYAVLLRNYFNPDRTMMALFPAAMRYAGPREAVFHAIVRKNYGCTHFIVGRDHAGVNRPDGTPYYGPYEAQAIFDNFREEKIGIRLFFYDATFYCRRCEGIVSEKTAPNSPETRFSLSGTKVRELLRSGQRPPPEIIRPEVADVLIQALHDERMEQQASMAKDI